MRNRLKVRALIGVALAFAMMAASCGDDDDAAPADEAPAAAEPAPAEPSDPEAAAEPEEPAAEPADDSDSAAAETADDAAAEPADEPDSAATEPADEAVAAPPANLADVCPSPIIVQHDWYPDYTHGPMFQLAGPDGEIDGNGYYNAEIEPGVTIQLRPGGPAVGFQPPSSLIYQDPSILIGMVSTDNMLGSSANAPVVGVVSPIAVSPIGLMWPADAYDFETVTDIAESDATVLVFGASAFVRWMTGTGLVREEQLDGSFDGSPSRFVVEGDLVQQNFITNEPWLYANEIEDWGGQPIDFLVMAEFGWEAYPGVGSLSVRPELLVEEADCLEVLVPRIQQAAVDFANDPSGAMQSIVEFGPQMGSTLSLSPGLQDWAASVMVDRNFFQNGPDGAAGSFDLDRLARFHGSFAPVLEAQDVEVGVGPAEMATNQFIDPSITFG